MYTVLCYGDSNTYGRDPVTKKRLPRDVRWPGVLQDELGKGYYVVEEGLNGRTTVWDDPVRGHAKRNGSKYLLPCLESHSPIDLVILMLGTNDLKIRYSVTPYDIAQSIGSLIEIILKSGCGIDDGQPEVLIMAPPPLGTLKEWKETFSGGVEKSVKLAVYCRSIADQYNCSFFDTATVIQCSTIDGLHFDPEEHRTLGRTVAGEVRRILRPHI
jgi:lysophospholipase L1-like esterase